MVNTLLPGVVRTESAVMYEEDLYDDFDNNVVPWDADYPPSFPATSPAKRVKNVRDSGTSEGGLTQDDSFAGDFNSLMVTAGGGSQPDIVFPLLQMPFEIRLEIYKWIHLLHPVKQAQLTPWYPSPVYSVYILKAICAGAVMDPRVCGIAGSDMNEPEAHPFNNLPDGQAKSDLLCPYRPLAGIPTAFQRANRQIYHEVRHIPFEENEFVYVNWFASGLWAARAFVKGLEQWQRDAMRYARLELLARDLSGAYAEEWKELCDLWSDGLRGLRLKIVSGAGSAHNTWLGQGGPVCEVKDDCGKAKHWVEYGLKSMKGLRWLEVELLVVDWCNEEKLEWCRSLEDEINQSKSELEECVRVACVQRDAKGS